MAHAFAAMHLVAIGLNGHSGYAGECQLSVKADVTADIAKATILPQLGSRVCGVAVETMTIEPREPWFEAEARRSIRTDLIAIEAAGRWLWLLRDPKTGGRARRRRDR